MIKALLFDYDGVITQGVEVGLPPQRLAEHMGITVDKASKAIISVWDGFSTGKFSLEEVWAGIEQQIGEPVPQAKRDIWYTWNELMPLSFMLDFVKELRGKNYKVGLASNVFKDTADIIREHGGYDAFDFCVLSYDIGARKPDFEIYEAAMKEFGDISPVEVLFLDDRQKCTDGAKEFGMQTILVSNHMEAVTQVREMLKLTS